MCLLCFDDKLRSWNLSPTSFGHVSLSLSVIPMVSSTFQVLNHLRRHQSELGGDLDAAHTGMWDYTHYLQHFVHVWQPESCFCGEVRGGDGIAFYRTPRSFFSYFSIFWKRTEKPSVPAAKCAPADDVCPTSGWQTAVLHPLEADWGLSLSAGTLM